MYLNTSVQLKKIWKNSITKISLNRHKWMNDNSNIVALILQFQEEEGGISRVLQRVTRDTYENFALQSRHVFSPLLKSKLSRHSARFIRNRNPRYPFSGGSNRLEFPTFFSVFQFLSDARRAFYFSKRCIKGCTFREVHRRWNKRFRLSIGSLLSFREEYTRSIVRAADR